MAFMIGVLCSPGKDFIWSVPISFVSIESSIRLLQVPFSAVLVTFG